MNDFLKILSRQWGELHFVCLGLDPETERMPLHLREGLKTDPYASLLVWAKEIIGKTHDLVAAYKPNKGFFEAFGPDGLRAYEDVIKYIRVTYPEILVIADVKIGEIGKSTKAYSTMPLYRAKANALTLNGYFGEAGIEPALRNLQDGMFILCHTSNTGKDSMMGSEEFQDLQVVHPQTSELLPLYQYVAQRVAQCWNKNRGNIGVVAGATFPEQLGMIRLIIGDLPMLIPGIGDQDGELEKSVRFAMDSQGCGFITNSSGGITFKSTSTDFATVARQQTILLNTQIIAARQQEMVRRKHFIDVLTKLGVMITGIHVVYASRRHGETYVNKDTLYPELGESDEFVNDICEQFVNDGIEVVLGPAIGGALLARDVARRLSLLTGRKVKPIFAEKVEKDDQITFVIKRGYDKIIKNKKTLIVDDVLTTGVSVRKTILVARNAGGIVVGLAVIFNRGDVKPGDVAWPTKMYSVISKQLPSYNQKDCPACKKGTPISTEYGKGPNPT